MAAPVGWGLAVTGLLAALGVTAALVPPRVIGTAGRESTGTTAPRGAGPTATPVGEPGRPNGPGPAGTGPDRTGPDGTGPDGTGPDGTGPDGTGAATTGAVGTSRTGTGPDGTRIATDTPAGIGPDGTRALRGTTAGRTAQGRRPHPAPPGSAPPGSGPRRAAAGAGDVGAARDTAGARDGKGVTGTSTPRTTEAPRTTAGDTFAGLEDEVVTLTNAERRRNGCDDLTVARALRTAERLHVREVAGHGGLYLSHVSDDGRSFAERARAQGYPDPGGENVARGQRSPADVVRGWMDGPGHRANIINCDFTAIGVGVATGDGTLVWGQLFGRS